MKLFLITQSVNNNYDTFDSAVVAAKNEHDARHTYPTEIFETEWRDNNWYWKGTDRPYGADDWTSPDNVEVKLIGTAAPGTEAGVICSSFNAG